MRADAERQYIAFRHRMALNSIVLLSHNNSYILWLQQRRIPMAMQISSAWTQASFCVLCANQRLDAPVGMVPISVMQENLSALYRRYGQWHSVRKQVSRTKPETKIVRIWKKNLG